MKTFKRNEYPSKALSMYEEFNLYLIYKYFLDNPTLTYTTGYKFDARPWSSLGLTVV